VLLDQVAAWCKKWRLSLNGSKTQVVHYRHRTIERSDFPFKCGALSLEYTDKYKYLGVWLEEHLDMSVTVRETAKSANRALGKVIAKFKNCGGSSHACFDKLYKAAVLPVITYSSGLWGLNEHGLINTVQNKAGRFLLGLPPKAPNAATQGEMGWNSIVYHTRLEVIRLFCRLKNTDIPRISYKVFSWAEHTASNNCKNWVFNVKKFLRSHNLSEHFNQGSVETKLVLKHCKVMLHKVDIKKWQKTLWNDKNNVNGNKLRTYRQFKVNLEKEEYLDINIPRYQRMSYTKLRCGVLPLAIETGRYTRTPLEQRLCTLCNLHKVENEVHFLIECPLYADLRFNMIQKACIVNKDFITMNDIDKFNFIMKCPEITLNVIKLVDTMFLAGKCLCTKNDAELPVLPSDLNFMCCLVKPDTIMLTWLSATAMW
jgi:hypothetical protein